MTLPSQSVHRLALAVSPLLLLLLCNERYKKKRSVRIIGLDKKKGGPKNNSFGKGRTYSLQIATQVTV